MVKIVAKTANVLIDKLERTRTNAIDIAREEDVGECVTARGSRQAIEEVDFVRDQIDREPIGKVVAGSQAVRPMRLRRNSRRVQDVRRQKRIVRRIESIVGLKCTGDLVLDIVSRSAFGTVLRYDDVVVPRAERRNIKREVVVDFVGEGFADKFALVAHDDGEVAACTRSVEPIAYSGIQRDLKPILVIVAPRAQGVRVRALGFGRGGRQCRGPFGTVVTGIEFIRVTGRSARRDVRETSRANHEFGRISL